MTLEIFDAKNILLMHNGRVVTDPSGLSLNSVRAGAKWFCSFQQVDGNDDLQGYNLEVEKISFAAWTLDLTTLYDKNVTMIVRLKPDPLCMPMTQLLKPEQPRA
jgi:hypothetical protein